MKSFQLLSNNIIKSPNDKNLYRSILLPNNLKCLLISDPETKRCAAAMHVGVGAQEDPLEYQGLAHFCEHMLFLGSKSFPVQNHYKDFVISNGGSSNAATGGTYTYYHFNIESTKFFQALEIWSKFFTEPLFTEDCVGKEINNVNSESVINVSDDSRRQYQVFKDICNHKSVLHRYNCGNLETLDKPGVRNALLEFHSKHYSANQMGLVLCGNQGLDELSEIAAEHFSAIVDKQLATIDYSGHTEKPFTPGVNLSKFVEILPIKTVHTLKIQFIFPPMLIGASEKNKPYSYLAHLVGHEGDGSLYAKLIGEGLITSLSAHGSDEESGLYGSFSIVTRLTQTGVANWQRVLLLTGLYIEMLKDKGLQKWVFDEKKDILEMGFRFKEKSAAQTMVTNLQAMYRRVIDPNMEDILNYHYKMEAYDEPELTRILNEFKVENALITLVDKGLESRDATYVGSTKAYEPIHDNTYWVRDLSPEEISMFQNPTTTLQESEPSESDCGKFFGLDFPKKNQFIPKDFTIFPQTGPKNPNPCEDPARLLTSFPIQIWDNEKSCLWFHQDDQFLLPKIKGSMTIYCGMLGGLEDHRQKLLASVWKSLLNEFCSDVTYAADCAEFHIGFGVDNTHLVVSFAGYSDSLESIFKNVVRLLGDFFESVKKPERVEQILENLVKNYRNRGLNPAQSQASYWLSQIKYSDAKTDKKMIKIAEAMDIHAEFSKFNQNFLRKTYTRYFIGGNIQQSAASTLFQTFESDLSSMIQKLDKSGTPESTKPLKKTEIPLSRSIIFPPKTKTILQTPNTNPKDANSALWLEFTVGPSPTLLPESIWLTTYLKEPYFTSIRTNQGLGYSVHCSPMHTLDVKSIAFIVQGAVESPNHCAIKTYEFLQIMRGKLLGLGQGEFERIREGA